MPDHHSLMIHTDLASARHELTAPDGRCHRDGRVATASRFGEGHPEELNAWCPWWLHERVVVLRLLVEPAGGSRVDKGTCPYKRCSTQTRGTYTCSDTSQSGFTGPDRARLRKAQALQARDRPCLEGAATR
jgi:hypothetical protein